MILTHLVRQFEHNRAYPEQEVNEVLKRFHPDTATLRRELIGYNLMRRDHGVYWRTDEAQWRREPPLHHQGEGDTRA